ncbi:DUF3592 domain-containing protein [Melittangium boletus]|uniref:DUF3592 domain-containing protein n=1 Tax=Melittangium boletus TaxID=83453 RepID=UPI003DA5407A
MRYPPPRMLLMVALVGLPLLAANGALFHVMAQQYRSASHPRASGLITRSEVVRAGKNSHGFAVRYTYEVQGVAYESTRYRYAAWSSSNKRRVEDFARRFPVGARVPVFYDPESPGEAVLITGVDGMYLFLLLFLNVFNMGMLMWVRRLLRGEDDELSPLAMGIAAMGGASLVLSFVLAAVTWVDTSLVSPVLAWGGVLATGVYFARKQRAKLAARERGQTAPLR